jgi:hypothetical protein
VVSASRIELAGAQEGSAVSKTRRFPKVAVKTSNVLRTK